MRTRLAIAFAIALALALSACAPAVPPGPVASLASAEKFAAVTWTFDKDAAGIPAGATVFAGTWAVRAEAGTPSPPNALCRTGSADYPGIGLSTDAHKDVAVTAKVKPMSERTDQAAGVLLRVRDAKNYYIVRANALEGNVVIYKYVNGSRSEIRSGSATIPAGSWHELRGEVAGSTIRGYWDGKLVVEGTNRSFADGGAGLWTKDDSVTCFDDVRLAPIG